MWTEFLYKIKVSYLQDKSKILRNAAKLLHEENLYPAVAHSAYYCCVQLMRHIWLYCFNKTEEDFKQELRLYNKQARIIGEQEAGTHEFLINRVGQFIKNSNNGRNDFRLFNQIWQLKRLRVDADYYDNDFSAVKSNNSLFLSQKIVSILQKH